MAPVRHAGAQPLDPGGAEERTSTGARGRGARTRARQAGAIIGASPGAISHGAGATAPKADPSPPLGTLVMGGEAYLQVQAGPDRR